MVSPVINMPNTQKHSGVSGIPTQLLVVHSGECPLRGGYAQSLTNWANTTAVEASWHWFADPIAIVSMVDPMLAAWHASEANPMSEGFEQAGYARFSRDEWLTAEGQKSIDNLGWILAQRMRANDIPHRWLTRDEVEAVTKRGNRSIKGLCLHRQIDPETRYDPGDNFPFDYLDARIRVHLGTAPATDPIEGLFMALSEQQQKDIYWILCTAEGQNHLAGIIARGVLNYEVPWYGADGQLPPEGQRRTVNLTAIAGWLDAMFGGTNRNINQTKELVQQLAAKQGVDIDEAALAEALKGTVVDYGAIAKAVNDDAAGRMAK